MSHNASGPAPPTPPRVPHKGQRRPLNGFGSVYFISFTSGLSQRREDKIPNANVWTHAEDVEPSPSHTASVASHVSLTLAYAVLAPPLWAPLTSLGRLFEAGQRWTFRDGGMFEG